MKDYCPKTCGMCATLLEGGEVPEAIVTENRCEDDDVRCPAWAAYLNYKCTSSFLQQTCPKACRICSKGPSYSPSTDQLNEAIIINGGHGLHLGDGSGCGALLSNLSCVTSNVSIFVILMLGKIFMSV